MENMEKGQEVVFLVRSAASFWLGGTTHEEYSLWVSKNNVFLATYWEVDHFGYDVFSF